MNMTTEIDSDIQALQNRALRAHLDREAAYERKCTAEKSLREIDATMKSFIPLLLCEDCIARLSKSRNGAIRRLHQLEHEENVAIMALIEAKDALGKRLTSK